MTFYHLKFDLYIPDSSQISPLENSLPSPSSVPNPFIPPQHTPVFLPGDIFAPLPSHSTGDRQDPAATESELQQKTQEHTQHKRREKPSQRGKSRQLESLQ